MNRLTASTAQKPANAIFNPRLNFLLGEEERTINLLIDYLETHSPIYPSDHKLSFVMSKLETIGGTDILTLHDSVANNLFDLANAAKITNPTKGWEPTYSEHYPDTLEYWTIGDNGNTRELIVELEEDPFYLMDALNPIVVHTHPYKHTASYLPMLNKSYKRTDCIGYAVISLDLPAIAVLYRLWQTHVQPTELEGQRKTVGMFISGYLISRLLKSSYDASIVNGVMGYLLPTQDTLDGPNLVTGSRLADDISEEIDQWALSLSSRRLFFGEFLRILPSISMRRTQYDRLTDNSCTSANAYVIMIADLRRLAMELTVNPDPTSKTSLEPHMRRMGRDWKNLRVEENLDKSILKEAIDLFQFIETALEN